MNYKTLCALSIFCIETHREHLPIEEALKIFEEYAPGIQAIYTDPEDMSLYSEKIAAMDPIEFMVDHVLFYACVSENQAVQKIMSNIKNYNK